jgi:hypothetical protein
MYHPHQYEKALKDLQGITPDYQGFRFNSGGLNCKETRKG